MHVTMLRLSFAYAIFTAPLVPAHLVDNTSNNWLRMTPFTVGFVKFCLLIFSFSVNDPLLMVLLDVRDQRHHLCDLFQWIQKSLSHFLWRCRCWIFDCLGKMLFHQNIFWNLDFWGRTETLFSEKRKLPLTTFMILSQILLSQRSNTETKYEDVLGGGWAPEQLNQSKSVLIKRKSITSYPI